MRAGTVEFLQAPVTAARLELEPLEVVSDDVVSGRLIEPDTGVWYRIDDGIADLVPSEYRNSARYEAFCRKHRLEPGPAPRGVGRKDDNTLKQIRFFSSAEAYEAEVVASPFYDVFDRVTVGHWIARTIKPGGRFYIMEPHNSPVRFIFDWMMRHWNLWKEEANDDPLFTKTKFQTLLSAGGLDARISYSTYLPPHLFYLISQRKGEWL